MTTRKRGRPTLDADDTAVQRRRQLTAARVREFYRRRKTAQAVTPASPQPPQAPLQHGEKITDLGFDDRTAAETLIQLGLFARGFSPAQNHRGAQFERRAFPTSLGAVSYDCNDHDSIEARHCLPQPLSGSCRTPKNLGDPTSSRRRPGPPSLSRFSPSCSHGDLPASNSTVISSTCLLSSPQSPVAPLFDSTSASVSRGTQTTWESEELASRHRGSENKADDEDDEDDEDDLEIPESDFGDGREEEEAPHRERSGAPNAP